MSDATDALRVVIVDDEEPARLALRQRSRRRSTASRSSPSARNGFEAVKAVGERRSRTCCCSTCRCRSSTASRCSSCIGGGRAGRLRHGVRRVRAARVRGARGGLSAEAVHARAAGGGAGARARARRTPGPVAGGAARERAARRARRSSASSSATARRCTSCRSRRSTTSRRRTTTSRSGRAGKLAAQGADAGGPRGAARPAAVRADPPVVSAQHRAAGARRAVREGQPRRDSDGRHEAAGQPVGVSAAAAAAVEAAGAA